MPASRSSSSRSGRTGACRWTWRAACSGCSTKALTAYLAARPDQVSLRLDWGDRLEIVLAAERAFVEPGRRSDVAIPSEDGDRDLPPALAAMVEARRVNEREAAESARRESIVALPPTTWREIQGRATSVGVDTSLEAGGGRLRLTAAIPALDAVSDPTAATR